jgi:hypothetical protein
MNTRKTELPTMSAGHLRQEVRETPAIFDQQSDACDSQIRQAPGIRN